MTGFTIKIIAMVTMILDHIKYAIPATECFITQYFGRISFPCFAFLIAEGIVHTKNKKKYFLRMTLFAIISQIPFMLFRGLVADMFLLNIMFTFLFAMIGIYCTEYFKGKEEVPVALKYVINILLLITICLCGNYIPVDYRWFGIVTVWIFYILRENKILRTIIYSLIVIFYYFSRSGYTFNNVNLNSVIFTILPAIIILFYNGKQGKKIKYFFYWFYPIHMLVVYGLSFLF